VARTEDPSQGDVVIGIAGGDGAGSLAGAIATARSGIAQYLDPHCTRIVVAESALGDAAIGEVEGRSREEPELTAVPYELDSRHLLRIPYHGLTGRLHALRALLETARQCEAKACAILDARLSGVTPERIRWLVRPLLDADIDFVTAYYPRNTLDGAITKSILYPMFRAVFQCPIRQPAARDFGCSDRALEQLLAQRIWEEDGRDEAIDIWMTTEAVCGGLRIAEAEIPGQQRELDTADLTTALSQVVGSFFLEVAGRASLWQRSRHAIAVRRVGAPLSIQYPEPAVDIAQLLDRFRLGYTDLKEVWGEVLPPMTMIELKKLSQAQIGEFHLDDRLWARIIYDFAVGHHLSIVRRDHLLGSLTPLYLGWLGSFALDVRNVDRSAVDARIESVCAGFESERTYLIARWRWPERFRS
jgi:hypothetical protein